MKVIYQFGDQIGPSGVIFVKEIEPNITPGGTVQRKAVFKCIDCDENFEATIQSVKHKNRKYCLACSAKHKGEKYIKDLSGKRYGKLYVKKLLPERKNQKAVYECQCDCGRVIKVLGNSLQQGLTTSCGLCRRSKGEDLICSLLDSLQIKYEREKRFKDCRYKNTLPFDFYLPDYNICIEYDGEQHFVGWNHNKDYLKDTQFKDSIKTAYCENKGIKLIRIPYTKYEQLNCNYLQQLIKN